jgi:hypothetical protein
MILRLFKWGLISIGALLGLPVVSFMLFYLYASWNWEIRILPGVVEIDRVLAARQTGGFREGCSYASYEIQQDFARELIDDGLNYLSHNHPKRTLGFNKYQDEREWKPTPIPEEPYLYAFGAANGCTNRPAEYFYEGTLIDAHELAKEPGNFYSTHGGGGGREGLIIISPKRRVAVYLYFG